MVESGRKNVVSALEAAQDAVGRRLGNPRCPAPPGHPQCWSSEPRRNDQALDYCEPRMIPLRMGYGVTQSLSSRRPMSVSAPVASRLTDQVPSVTAVDLFCGIGGMTHGLLRSGIEVKAGFDIDPSCRYAYETNNPHATFIESDIRRINSSDIVPFYADAATTALVGCAPCQPYSSHNRKIRSQGGHDSPLVRELCRLVLETSPDIVSMENVPGLRRHGAFQDFVSELNRLQYNVACEVLYCADYGIPQKRRRLVLLASRIGDISLPPPTNARTTVADFLMDLPNLDAGERHSEDPAHVTLPLTPKNRRRIQQSRPGSTWRDWEDQDISNCHKKAYFPASYGRMRWDALAPTITTQFCYYSTGRFGHPKQDRTISIREGALLQTFPRDYSLTGRDDPMPVSQLARHIGNAVPVALAQAIGESILAASNVREPTPQADQP